MVWADDLSLYHITLLRPDFRWYQAEVIATSRDAAIAAVRQSAGLPDAPVVLCDISSTEVEPIVLWGEVVTPRGWKPTEEAS